jgi:hypothetical protein
MFVAQLPLGMPEIDASRSSRYHLLRAVELGCRGSIDALLAEVQGQPRSLMHSCLALSMVALVVVVVVFMWLST